MKFKTPLHEGKFIKRYKRFFADIELNHEIIVAHTANTGSMKTCLGERWPVLLSYHDSPTRKLKYSLEMIHNGQTWIGVNTALTNHLAIEAIKSGVISELQGYEELIPESKIGKSRIDILLRKKKQSDCYVEVKNVTLVDQEGYCLFPDSVTERGLKHLDELLMIKQSGKRAVLLFIVQREDCHTFKREQSFDSKYCSKLKQVMEAGVEVIVYQCKLNLEEIIVTKSLPII
jgi:sugar fermentation stimulation protein A